MSYNYRLGIRLDKSKVKSNYVSRSLAELEVGTAPEKKDIVSECPYIDAAAAAAAAVAIAPFLGNNSQNNIPASLPYANLSGHRPP